MGSCRCVSETLTSLFAVDEILVAAERLRLGRAPRIDGLTDETLKEAVIFWPEFFLYFSISV